MVEAREPGATEAGLGIFGLEELPLASSLMSSRWSRDNLVTSHPGRLYDGKVLEPIGIESLKLLLAGLEAERGPIRPGACRVGVHTWDVRCADDDGPFVLQVPLFLDEPGARKRTKRDVPRQNVENMRHFRKAGLTRFLGEPRGVLTLDGRVPAAMLPALPEHHPITVGRGSAQVELLESNRSFLLSLGPGASAELLSELVASLAYHYDVDADGGTAITDVCLNDGDFVVRRRVDGSFDVRLTAVRRREPGIRPSLLLLYFAQLMAYEDWSVDGELMGLPVLASNPSIAFEGLVRGRRYRMLDLGRSEAEGRAEAERFIEEFGHSPEGRSYRPWVERFLEGRLPPAFGADLREHWWRLMPVETKLGVLELRAREAPGGQHASSERSMRAFLTGLRREIGRAPVSEPDGVPVNDLGRDTLLALLREAGVTEGNEAVADEILLGWPYRSWDHLLARVPNARVLRRLKSRLGFGHVVAQAEQGTLKSVAAEAKDAGPGRPIANHEIFGQILLPSALQAAAAETFPTFEAFMDAALHDPKWGYYGHGVVIGSQGHFDTHPETLTPHYGRWIARGALNAWRALVAAGDLGEADEFPVVEFGAGNGRLARDFLDAVAALKGGTSSPEQEELRRFAARVRYLIYETSASLRDRQRALLGNDATIEMGDARRPGEALQRDFPGGFRGFVVSNEVPDAFGVHKLLLTRDGRAFAVLVVPRAESPLSGALDDALSRRIADADARLRGTFGFGQYPNDAYLDAATYAAVMEALATLPAPRRDALRAHLWFEEALVPTSLVPAVAAHLRANARDYASALAEEDAGVVLYVNLHADRFVRELGAALTAGFVVTVDYGETTRGLVQGARRGEFPFRVYGDWQEYVPRPNDPYALPGTQDMTADVNFTELARAGREAGLEVLHFGLERDITGAELPLALRGADQDTFQKFLGNPLFKVLVLGTRAAVVFDGSERSPLPLFHGDEQVPKARRHLIAAIEKNLSSAP